MLAPTPVPVRAQLAPPATGGVVELDRLLQRLAEPRRVLVIGAHPDDEDSELLAYASRGLGARAAYLSLSRGEGGQNLIGEELGEGLGLIRSGELLAARSVDGGEQFFTRAFDFGFSKNLDEALRFWPADSVLKDAVRVVRLFRPQVIVSVFSGTPRDGHGQHQEAGVTARRVFDAAGDSTMFPELWREEGLRPWTPLRLYQSTRFDTSRTTQVMWTGGLEPRTGQTYRQLAALSRSQHRSQDMGQLQPLGPSQARVGLIRDRVAGDNAPPERGADLFAGIPQPAGWLPGRADSLRGVLSADHMADLVKPLAQALDRLDREGAADSVTRTELSRALTVAASVETDAFTSTEELLAGDRLELTVQLYNAGRLDATLDSFAIQAPAGWRVEPLDAGAAAVAAGTLATRHFTVTVPAEAPPSQPYFLERPRIGAMYDWSAAPPSVRGRPFGPPLLTASAYLTLQGAHPTLSREVTYRYQDQARGEIRRPLHVVPAVDVRLEPDGVVWPASDSPKRTFTVTLVSHARDAVSGDVRLVADGWPAPAAVPFTLARAGDSRVVTLDLARPPAVRHATTSVRAVARTQDGREFGQGVEMIEYPHIRPTPYVREAAATVRVAPMALPRLARVGYVRGASDRVPEALRDFGIPIVLLSPQDLAEGDLSRFDAIVVGSRAYETDTALVRHNQRVLDYAKQGGLLLVQYQQYPFIRGGFAPYPLTIASPHDRVTAEDAPVTVLAPNHPAFTAPNQIDSLDWNGWPQERGLYFAHTWDAAYTPLLEMHDPGDPPLQGGLLVARLGSGTYVYTGLSFFRALPAGVPGAYRLFLNLLALHGR
jgi:LmbE family N-acetylglucosaminyl deacetylase